ncbi:hypothetical protein SCP_0400240 [Sparassis crispa]|uniref:Uncharacterized protein n=1 Tax=Sparassis crispa TaxID=139825 RepID=A0A401GHQ3_9APHY|nr:hypothetical protein SCP_0400240 [Sparassis crispa]GBE81653.1 hypothetical protein SCP_0400240 [Sparassis crispa]
MEFVDDLYTEEEHRKMDQRVFEKTKRNISPEVLSGRIPPDSRDAEILLTRIVLGCPNTMRHDDCDEVSRRSDVRAVLHSSLIEGGFSKIRCLKVLRTQEHIPRDPMSPSDMVLHRSFHTTSAEP